MSSMLRVPKLQNREQTWHHISESPRRAARNQGSPPVHPQNTNTPRILSQQTSSQKRLLCSHCSILLKAHQQTNRPFRIASQTSSVGASSFPWRTCPKNDRISSKATQMYISPLVWPTSPPATARRCAFAGTYQERQALASLSMPNFSGEQQIIL